MKYNNKKAFSLAEMMVVMLIISIALAAMMPIMTKKKKIDTTMTPSSVPAGTIITYAGSSTPVGGWLLCNGDSYSSIGKYNDLYKAIGDTYTYNKTGTNFNVPDLRGLFIRGAGINGNASAKFSKVVPSSGAVGTLQEDSTASPKSTSAYNLTDGTSSNAAYKKLSSTLNLGFISLSWDWSGNDTSGTATGFDNGGYGVEPNIRRIFPGDAETRPKNIALNYYIKY